MAHDFLNTGILVIWPYLETRMSAKKIFLILSLFVLLQEDQLMAQDFSREGSHRQMEGISDREKVHFIIKNFYKLYSADFSNSEKLCGWAAETSHAQGWRLEEAKANLGWGVITYLSGDYEHVLPKYFRARDLFDSLKDKSGIASINNEMAVFYYKTKDLPNAFRCLEIAEKNATEVNDLENLGTTMGHRGAFLSREGRYKEAEPYYREVYEIRKKTSDSVGLGYVLLDLAQMALLDGKIEESFSYIDQSTSIRKKIGDLQGVAINHVARGENYFQLKQFHQAIRWFQSGLDLSLAIGYTDLVRHNYDYLSKSYLALNDYKMAFELQEKANAYKDSLFNLDRTRVIQELQAKYDDAQKDLRISALSKDNELKTTTIERNYILIGGLAVSLGLLFMLGYLWRNRTRQEKQAIAQEQKVRLREAQVNAVIDSQESERRRFASDLHDGMGQLVSALQLNIQSIRQSNDLEKTVAQVDNSENLLQEIQQEIRNIAFNLMPPVLTKEGLVPAVRELIRRINKSGSIKATLKVYDVEERFSEVVEISLYRIIQELISNIVKHAQASMLTISFTGHETEVILTLEDDGKGYDLNAFQQSKTGNGWSTVTTRLNLIRGQIDFDTMPGRNNNTVMIHVPGVPIQAKLPLKQNT